MLIAKLIANVASNSSSSDAESREEVDDVLFGHTLIANISSKSNIKIFRSPACQPVQGEAGEDRGSGLPSERPKTAVNNRRAEVRVMAGRMKDEA